MENGLNLIKVYRGTFGNSDSTPLINLDETNGDWKWAFIKENMPADVVDRIRALEPLEKDWTREDMCIWGGSTIFEFNITSAYRQESPIF